MFYKYLIIAVCSFVFTFALTKALIPFLKKHQFKQFVREEGPESHKKKTGTPSMGGLAIIVGILLGIIVAMLFYHTFNLDMVISILMMLLFGLIGFLDDYKKAIEKKNDGLSPRKKLVFQIVFSLILAIYCYLKTDGLVYIPFFNLKVDFGFFIIPWIVFVMTAFSNAVNLTDGLDGLASGVTSIVSIAMIIVSTFLSYENGYIMYAALLGACLGFLMLNKNPAKIFMGDTGSMAIGGFIATVSILNGLEIVLAIAGLIYVFEAVSVVIQVGYFKLSHGKRVFKMAPIHHHFELCGMEEKNVVFMFWGFSILFAIISILSVVI